MAFVCEIKLKRNFVDTHIAVQKPQFNQAQFVVDDILLQRFTGLFFKVFPR